MICVINDTLNMLISKQYSGQERVDLEKCCLKPFGERRGDADTLWTRTAGISISISDRWLAWTCFVGSYPLKLNMLSPEHEVPGKQRFQFESI